MLNINLKTALTLCEINKFEKPFFSNESSVILFHFDGTKQNLATYLHLMLETKHILILNPLNRKKYTNTFHGVINYEFIFGLEGSFKNTNTKNINTFKASLIDKDVRLVIPTSGTTADPKLFCFSTKKLTLAAKNISDSLFLSKNDTALGYLPTNYTYGLSVLHSHLYVKSKFLLPEYGQHLLACFKNDLFSHIYCVPSSLNSIKKYAYKFLNNKSLKMLCQAGGPLSNSEAKFWFNICKKNKVEFVRMYGQTECGPRISCLRSIDFLNNPETVGKPINGVEVFLNKKTSELLVDSTTLADGYLKYQDNEWFIKSLESPYKTGDIGKINKDGYISIDGRASRFAKIQDMRISLDEIEFIAEEIALTDIGVIESKGKIAIIPSNTVSEDLIKKISKKLNLPARNFILLSPSFFSLNGNNKKNYKLMESNL